MPAALAVTAAHKQGKYWEYYYKLWDNMQALEDADLERYAQELGLNVEQWKKDIADPVIVEAVEKQARVAQALGASGTPAFFVNGEFISGAKDTKEFQSIINTHKTKAETLMNRGVPVDKLHGLLTKDAFKGKYVDYIMHGKDPGKPKGEGGAEAKGKTFVKQVKDIPIGDSPRKGSGDKIVIIEFSEFECPFCSKVVEPLDQVVAHFGSDASLVFKHYPLNFHKKAMLAAEASFAAHAQGKFWEFYKLAFAGQPNLERADLENYAKQVGLDMSRFREALDKNSYQARVKQDMALANKIGVGGTPTIFVNGRKWEGGKEAPEIIKAIEEEILKKN